MPTITARLDRLEARAPRVAGRAVILSDDELQAHLEAMIAKGQLWQDDTGRWHGDGPDVVTVEPYTDAERAMMLASFFNALQDQNKEGETNV